RGIGVGEAPVIGGEEIASLRFRDRCGKGAPRLGKDVGNAIEEPVDLALAAKKYAAENEGAAALRVPLGIVQGEGRTPGAAEHDPALDAEMAAQRLDIADEMARRIVGELADRRR